MNTFSYEIRQSPTSYWYEILIIKNWTEVTKHEWFWSETMALQTWYRLIDDTSNITSFTTNDTGYEKTRLPDELVPEFVREQGMNDKMSEQIEILTHAIRNLQSK